MDVVVVRDEASVIERLWSFIQNAAEEAIAQHGVFRVGLSGGSLIKYLASGAANCSTDWSKWQLFFCDERFVDETNEDSTFGQYKKLFLPKTKLNESQFVTIDRSLALHDCARAYEQQIYEKFGVNKLDVRAIPRFDVLLLGMGPDGHTCSLFPDHELLTEDTALIAPISDSPKPPPERITMTYPLINNAKLCIFALSGVGKAEMVKRILLDEEPLPAGLVKPIAGQLVWILDDDAASLYNKGE